MEVKFHSVSASIETVLRDGGYWYEKFIHEPVRTSEEAAQVRTGYELRQGAKSLIVKGKQPGKEKQFIMIVVPGDKQFDKAKLRNETGFTDIRFATPDEVAEITSGVLPGGVPPWGNLFELPVYADKDVFLGECMIFNAGDRRVSIAMRTNDYLQLISPHIVVIT